MKKIILIIAIFFLSLINVYWSSCDQTFYWTLRHWKQYQFFDDYWNNKINPKWINSIEVSYSEEVDYNWSSSFPSFSWSNWIESKNFILDKWDYWRVIDADSQYPIIYHPVTRSQNNLVIKYTAKYFEQVWWTWNFDNPKYHTECKYYDISWCWDKVRDSNEACDPNDPSESWWWTNGCSTTCEPIEVAETTCDSLTATPSSARNSLTSTLECSWTNASSYVIEVRDSSDNLLETINNSTWSVVLNTRWTYTANCVVDWTITSPSCNTALSVTGWWGWSWSACDSFVFWTWTWGTNTTVSPNVSPNNVRNITYWWNTLTIPITCWSNQDIDRAYVDCWNWIETSDATAVLDEATLNCTYSTTGNATYVPRCYVYESSSSTRSETSTACTWRIALWGGWGWGWGWYCWDWVLQWSEECDFWRDEDWNNLNWDPRYACDSNCKLSWNSWAWHTEWIFTVPGEWDIILTPNDDIIIWEWINPFAQILKKPQIINNSTFDIKFNELCVILKEWDNFNKEKECISAWWVFEPWDVLTFEHYPNFISNITGIWWSFKDNVIVTTINTLVDAYFVWELNVRVSKPSIATLWGWTSFVDNSQNIADINDVARAEDKDKNNNFVWAWISETLSSETKNIDDDGIITKTSEEWSENNDIIDWISNSDWWITSSSSDFWSFSPFNWMTNVDILKDTNFKIDSDIPSMFEWARTYIIDGANLIITNDITYPENIAFVVKWWNIIINSWVKEINWVFISIPDEEWNGWKIKWQNTKNILTVKWSLYWDLTDLVSNRTYIEEVNWFLNVWTIVSFGSSIFRQPAPLTGQFIWEYLESTKIAK